MHLPTVRRLALPLSAALLATVLLVAGPAEPAAAQPADRETAGPLARVGDALARAWATTVEALAATLDAVTGYGLPEVRPNGDVVIPRTRPPAEVEPAGPTPSAAPTTRPL